MLRAWNVKPTKEEAISQLLWELEYWEDIRTYIEPGEDWEEEYEAATIHIVRIKDVLEYLDFYPEVKEEA